MNKCDEDVYFVIHWSDNSDVGRRINQRLAEKGITTDDEAFTAFIQRGIQRVFAQALGCSAEWLATGEPANKGQL